MAKLAALMNLQGRRALITGATGHLGRVMAQTLAEQGADLVLVDRPGTEFASLRGELAALRATRVDTLECDLESQAERDTLLATVLDQAGKEGLGLDILINNAAFVGTTGLQGWVTDFERQSVDTWRRALEVNLTAVFDLCKGLTPLLQASRGASIINIASIYGVLGPNYNLYEGTAMGNPAAYAASKGGLIQLTRWLATTLAPRVRVNAVTPGGIWRGQPESFVERYARQTPLGRMASEDDFRGVIAFLSSDMSAYCTGQNLHIDGGWGTW